MERLKDEPIKVGKSGSKIGEIAFSDQNSPFLSYKNFVVDCCSSGF